MLHRYIAALLLLPSSLYVYRSPRAWFGALAKGPYVFFSQIIRQAPSRVRRTNFCNAIFVYWPMKTGIDLARSGSLKSTAKKCLKVLTARNQESAAPAGEPRKSRVSFIPMEHIRNMLHDADIKIVSFDIFDTLLVRPVLHPKDIFYLLAAKMNAAYGVDFIKLRWDAEARLGKENANIYEIYADVRRRFKLLPQTATALLEEEIRCETTLLTPRPEVKALYEEAVKLGKRVIATSDMYLPGTILDGILKKNGMAMDAIYVSCDQQARKSSGALYDIIISSEKAHPSEILHIGDNYKSDFENAIAKKITAVHYPSIQEEIFGCRDVDAGPLLKAGEDDPAWRMLLAFSLNSFISQSLAPGASVLDAHNLRHFTALTIAPMLTGYALALAADKDIQAKYKQINFASRDGYLPHAVYGIIQRHLGGLPGRYCHAGRRAYYPFLYASFYDYAKSRRHGGDMGYTLYDFLKAHFTGSALLAHLDEKLTEVEKNTLFFEEKEKSLSVITRFQSDIELFLRDKRARIQKYYNQTLSREEERHLIFDLGYSGSISRALSAVVGKPVDKLYFWEDPENRSADKQCGTSTRVFAESAGRDAASRLVFEELFSPCEGGVVDFDEKGQPVFETLAASEAMETDLAAVHTACRDFAEAFCAQFGEYAKYVTLTHGEPPLDICHLLLNETPFCNQRVFRNILFPDPVYHNETHSLEKKLERFLPQKTVFSGTGFDTPHTARTYKAPLTGSFKLGIHLHLHNILLVDEVVRYLQEFPADFDLYVTITDAAYTQTVARLLNRALIPGAKNVVTLPGQNRGRDVAPWILGMRPYQAGYDLFCHIHAKESSYLDFGEEWRAYLFDNLIHGDAVREIIGIFHADPQMGCLFPPVFGKLHSFMTTRNIPLSGLTNEMDQARRLLRRMGLRDEICRSEIFFPVGNMLWYRPHALRQLFTFDLALEEFAAEPIGVEGTLAHALERLPALIAARNGYQAGTFARTA